MTGFHLPPSVLSGKMLKHARSSSSVLSFCLLIIFYSMINICLCHFSTSVDANPLERCSYLFNPVSVVSITIFPIAYLVALEHSQSLCAIMVKELFFFSAKSGKANNVCIRIIKTATNALQKLLNSYKRFKINVNIFSTGSPGIR